MMRVLSVAVLSLVMLAVVPVATAEAAGPPGLSVSIRNGRGEVRSGDRIVYTTTVRNAGTDSVNGRLVITVPEFLSVTDPGGAHRTGLDASWAVTVPAGGSVTETLTGRLGTIPQNAVRVTTIVGFYVGDADRPAIRSAEADTIAGVTDPAHAVNDRSSGPRAPAAFPMGWVVLGLGAVLVLALGAGLISRRRTMSGPR